jgi:hypothetical protein
MSRIIEIKLCSLTTSHAIRELAILETGTNILAKETNIVASLTEHREPKSAKE